jgi:hypothetical protein
LDEVRALDMMGLTPAAAIALIERLKGALL